MTDTLQMTMTVTDAGRAAVTNAQSNGLSAEITHIAIGSGSGTPAASDTALVNEIKRLPAGTGSNPSPSELYTETSDFSGESYSVYEFAAVLSDGTLLAVYRQSTPIIETTSVVPLLLQISIPIKSFPPGSVVINGDTNFQTPPATESMRGVAEVATQAEVDAGTDHQRMVTAKTLTSRLASFTRNATESVKGFVEIATQSEVDSGTDHQRTVTPKTLKSRLASFARGATESVKGFVEIATQSEVDSGTDHQRTVTPKTLKSRLASFARGATESVKGFVEIATQTEVNTGTDDSRAVTPKKLWGLLSAKFARTDTRPSFQQGVYLNNKPIVMNEAGSTNIDHIWYDDQEGIGTYHFVADSNEQATGNANLKMGGIQLSSGNNVTGVSDSTSSTSTATLASSKAVKSATDAGTRQATESTRGQLEVATQTEANSSTD
uniref:phage tail protein n=1 Tax=Candidatus Sororendozoicomonas aggregata TaxID=3073239 RepID=UPI002ED58A47